ncbi:SpoIIE family protein phosphatase [Sorangium cellulosum]|uniref:Phosphoserine phosphatase n=1 Tax=Sorangium cellulosum TaxID=56 RepID=A0A150QLQ3_SORCE|nr:SpoIIE family protein phosphatase [Sorangium cellulosum]KYF68598.1 phosphoserine phosphatase [Sorangium cellulosum]
MAAKRPTIALLTDYLTGEYQSEVRFGVERAAEEHDVNLLVAFGDTHARPGYSMMATTSIYPLISAETVDGLVIVSSALTNHLGAERTHAFCRSYAPLPMCSVGLALDGVPSVIVDNARGAETIVAHMLDHHACQRVAYISGPPSNEEATLRADAYRRVLAARSIPYDERLFVLGDFLIEGGRRAMRELLARRVDFDGVIAGNDNMALGAMDEIKAHGLDVPGDVLVCGFDDVAVSRVTKPSLTTIRQPIKQLGALAVAKVVRMIRGERVPDCSLLPVELTRRESCGCGYYETLPRASARGFAAAPAAHGPPTLGDQRDDVERALASAVLFPGAPPRAWPGELLSALEEELAGEQGRFLQALKRVLDDAAREGAALDQFQGVVTLLRARLRRACAGAQHDDVERLWHACRALIAHASTRAEAERRLHLELASVHLSWTGRCLSTCLSLPLLRRTLAAELPGLSLTRAAVSLYDDPKRATLRSLFLMEDGRDVEPPRGSFPARSLAPPGFLGAAERWSVFAMPITFGETEHYGIAALGSGANEVVYDTLRLQLGSALKAVAMHREIVRQVEIRERLEQEQRRQESVVAQHIQTKLVPPRLAIEGLDLCAFMRPAAEVGGDYYDVIGTPEGGWIGIGDVAGHGLAAGLVMLMIQSMVAAMARRAEAMSPAEIISALNQTLHDNIRCRLKRDEHATLVLLRYERGGRVTFAGAHDDIIVCRASTRRCACIPSSGVWVGVLPSIDAMTRDAELVLEDGDVLVLYSDGVTEARNVHREQFGIERLCAAIEAAQAEPVDAIRDRILRDVDGWCPSPDDDITIVVARYHAPPDAR